MRKYAVLVLVAILILAIGGCAPFSPAPPTKAILKGRVVVPEGAVRQVGGQALAGATVNVIDPVTGNIVATTTTDVNGNYQVEVPPGGPYIIEVVKGSKKVLDVSPQVEAGETYPLGVADATSTAVALVFQAKVEAGEDPAEIDLEELAEDPKIKEELAQAVEEALAAGEDPTTAPEVIHLVDVIVTPPKPTTPTTPSTPVTPTPTASPAPKPAMEVEYYTGTGFKRSTSPIVESSGNVVQTVNADGSITITVKNPPNYIDSGFVMDIGTLEEIGTIEVTGTGDYLLNLYFDVNGDGEFFSWNADGTFAGVGGDAYATDEVDITSGKMVIDNSSKFWLMVDPQGRYTLSELKTKYGINTRVGIWVGVASMDGGEKTVTISSVRVTKVTPV